MEEEKEDFLTKLGAKLGKGFSTNSNITNRELMICSL